MGTGYWFQQSIHKLISSLCGIKAKVLEAYHGKAANQNEERATCSRSLEV